MEAARDVVCRNEPGADLGRAEDSGHGGVAGGAVQGVGGGGEVAVRVIIAGSRTVRDYRDVLKAIAESGFEISQVVCGMAQGADLMGRFWAKNQRPPIEVAEFPADWKRLGKQAGFARNYEMARNADALIAVWDGYSRGTEHMISVARKLGLQMFVWKVGKKG